MAAYWPYAAYAACPGAQLARTAVAEYSALMTASQPMVIEEVMDAYPLHRHRCLLDVGAGEGRFVATLATAAPGLKLMLFDLPAVAQLAQQRLDSLGLAGRVGPTAQLLEPLAPGATS
jgi:demethylspheroidene O-methyltransferase